MKLLRIRAEGLPLHKNPFDVSFYALQRVQKNHMEALSHLFGNVYINTAEAFIGINASGKTTALRVVSFASMLLCATPMNAGFVPKIISDDSEVVFDIDFYASNKIYHLQSKIVKTELPDGSNGIRIISEKLWGKNVNSKVNKSNFLAYDESKPIRVRDNSDEYLSDDVSIVIAIKKQIQEKDLFVDLSVLTDFNLFTPDDSYASAEIISVLDPTIEYIKVEKNQNKKTMIKLKFQGQPELVLLNLGELPQYLSSGTVKGLRVFTDAARVLKQGGYLFIDEIENHFNKELVVSLLRLFMSRKTNPKGAVIIFTTHYSELLDDMVRNDAIFITRNNDGLSVANLNSLLKRNDMKKSEVYQSNFLGGTAPKYQALLALKNSIIAAQEM